MNRRPFLISPSAQYEESYRAFVDEMREVDGKLVPFVLGLAFEKFEDLLTKLEQCSKGVGLPDGFVPHSTYWLVDKDEEIVGVSNVRHCLTPKLKREGGHIGYGIRPSKRGLGFGTTLLKESLGKAKDLGIEKVLITCRKQNLGSVGVIKNNRGVLVDEEFVPEVDAVIQRYWMELDK